MERDHIKAPVREFILRFVRWHDLADGDDIFAGGLANSLFAMQLVQFVETEFGVAVVDDDLDLDNFRSVDAISAFVERKSAAAGAA